MTQALKSLFVAMGIASLMIACTPSTDAENIDPTYDWDYKLSQEKQEKSSSSSEEIVESSATEDLSLKFKWIKIENAFIIKGNSEYTISDFSIANTEVTQEVYKSVMKMPTQLKNGDNYPVENVSWYDAVLFCNEFSKRMGTDTIYAYTSIGTENYLKDLTIDYSKSGYRLPTEMEWEIAARGGTSTTYYWNVDVASAYAYYAQTNGPSEVAQIKPNQFELYDMAGNVSEWVNDWYDSYEVKSIENPIGPLSGAYRCIRGGGWSDKVTALASAEREKKDAKYKSHSLGFRLVYSEGF